MSDRFTLPPAALDLADETGARLFLITGPSGAGKTTWCGELAELARARGLRLAGLWSPAVFVNGRKIGIDMVDLRTQERRRLANLRGKEAAAVATIQWAFDPEVIAWGNAALDNLPPHDLLVIDELGPLEFMRGEGLLAGLRVLDAGAYRVAVVVIRPSLLPEAQARWPHAQVIRFQEQRLEGKTTTNMNR
jgi:nucleoside-triphosphatase